MKYDNIVSNMIQLNNEIKSFMDLIKRYPDDRKFHYSRQFNKPDRPNAQVMELNFDDLMEQYAVEDPKDLIACLVTHQYIAAEDDEFNQQ